jgi:hypothetical protein
MMGYINYKDHALIKRQRVGKKMNVTGGMFKDEKKKRVTIENNFRLLLEVVNVFKILEFKIT